MKKLFSLCLICLLAVSAMAQHAPASEGYVDLGLPSGTLWKNANEGGDDALYNYDEAVRKFGNKLPTKQQLEELKNKCTWTWTGNGYKVTGPNGESITLPAAGSRWLNEDVYGVGTGGSYWSSTPNDSVYAWELYFNSSGVNMDDAPRCIGQSVRLVYHAFALSKIGRHKSKLSPRLGESFSFLFFRRGGGYNRYEWCDYSSTATHEHQSGNEVVSEDTANQLLPFKNGERESVFTFLNTKTCISLADMRFFVYLCSKIMLNNKF